MVIVLLKALCIPFIFYQKLNQKFSMSMFFPQFWSEHYWGGIVFWLGRLLLQNKTGLVIISWFSILFLLLQVGWIIGPVVAVILTLVICVTIIYYIYKKSEATGIVDMWQKLRKVGLLLHHVIPYICFPWFLEN